MIDTNTQWAITEIIYNVLTSPAWTVRFTPSFLASSKTLVEWFSFGFRFIENQNENLVCAWLKHVRIFWVKSLFIPCKCKSNTFKLLGDIWQGFLGAPAMSIPTTPWSLYLTHSLNTSSLNWGRPLSMIHFQQKNLVEANVVCFATRRNLMQQSRTRTTTPNSSSPLLKPLSTASTTSSELKEAAKKGILRIAFQCLNCCHFFYSTKKKNLSLRQGSLGKICFPHREARCRRRPRKTQQRSGNGHWTRLSRTARLELCQKLSGNGVS